MIRLTPMGGILLLVQVFLYLASLTSQSPLLLFPIGICAALHVVNWAVARRSLKWISVTPPRAALVAEGQRAVEPWRVANGAKQAAHWISLNSAEGTLSRIRTIGAGQTATIAPEMAFPSRGVYPHSQVRVSTSYPFGLIRASRKLALEGETLVYPAAYPIPAAALKAGGFDVMVGGRFRGKGHTNSGIQFAGVRPVHPGDPLKHVHWKSSAKGLGLMVKTFDEELSGRVGVILDSGAATDRDALDNCVRAAASLIFAALDAGHHVEWHDLGREHPLLIPPFADGAGILELLARVEARAGRMTEARLQNAVARLSSRSAVSFVLACWNPDVEPVVEDMASRKRKVAVFLPAGTNPVSAGFPAEVFHYSSREIQSPGELAGSQSRQTGEGILA